MPIETALLQHVRLASPIRLCVNLLLTIDRFTESIECFLSRISTAHLLRFSLRYDRLTGLPAAPNSRGQTEEGLAKRLSNIQRNERDIRSNYFWWTVRNPCEFITLHEHFHERAFLLWVPKSRPNKRITRIRECALPTLHDELCAFVISD